MNDFAPVQLSLGVSLNDDATFDNFYVSSEQNALVIHSLKTFARGEGDSHAVIWGSPGSGLTHLLQATARSAQGHDALIQYLPLRELVGYAAMEVCEGLDHCSAVFVDKLDVICGNRAWERALFNLYNDLRERGHRLLMTTHTSPAALPLVLPDLKSRVLGATVFHVEGLTDPAKARALQKRAAARGLDIAPEVIDFVLKRAPRNMHDLFTYLDRLDDASLQEQRKLTIPFVKKVLAL